MQRVFGPFNRSKPYKNSRMTSALFTTNYFDYDRILKVICKQPTCSICKIYGKFVKFLLTKSKSLMTN